MQAAALALVALVLALAGGCDDPTLRVEVIPTEGFAPVETTVTVYQSDTLTCSDVELGLADADTLSASFVAEAIVEQGDALIGVSRLEPKLFVAEARDAEGRRLYAGCEARGEITGHEVVTITTQAIATITVSGDSVDRPFAVRRIGVAAVDAVGRPIDRRHVEWVSYGVDGSFDGAGEMRSNPAVCTRRGLATIEPRDPDTPGPIAAQIRVSWADHTPPPLSGFIENVTPKLALADPGGTERLPPSCVVRREPDDHVYCLKRPVLVSAPRDVVEIDLDGGGQLSVDDLDERHPTNHLIATDHDGDGLDDLYVVERVLTTTRVRFAGVLGAGTPDPGSPAIDACAGQAASCDLVTIRQVVQVPGCGASTGFVAINFELSGNGDNPNVVVFTDLRGVLAPVEPMIVAGGGRIDLLAAGCVAEATTLATLHQAFAMRITPTDQLGFNQLVAQCDGEPCRARWQGFGAVGFSGGATPRLISSELDITGNVIVESEIVPIGDGDLLLIEKGRTATASQARAIDTGDLDLDGHEDLAWSQFLPDVTGTVSDNRLQIAVGRDGLPFPGRLTGVSPGVPGAQAELLIARVDDDELPDLITFSDEEAAVYRSGVEVPHGNPPGEETLCP